MIRFHYIENLPHERPAMANFNNTTPPQAVTFSEFSELVFIPCDHEKSAKWYSSEDKYRFRQTLIDNVRQLKKEINALSHGEIMTQEQLCKCVGIEMFLTKEASRYAEQAKRTHIDAVLLEQRRQKQIGICDRTRLSTISQKGSGWTNERARKLAAGYAALSME